MEPKIERHPAYRIVGMKVRGKNQQGEIPKMWGEFAARVAEVQDRAEQDVTYGVSANYAEDTGEFDYVAGIHVNPTAAVPQGMVSWDIPAQTYAVFSCTLPTIGETMNYIHHTWLPASGYHHTGGPELERYDEDFNSQDPASIMYILVPVAKPDDK
jgi:AraC family transcriptional regulator